MKLELAASETFGKGRSRTVACRDFMIRSYLGCFWILFLGFLSCFLGVERFHAAFQIFVLRGLRGGTGGCCRVSLIFHASGLSVLDLLFHQH